MGRLRSHLIALWVLLVSARASETELVETIMDESGVDNSREYGYEYLAPEPSEVNMVKVTVAQKFVPIHIFKKNKDDNRRLELRFFTIQCDCQTESGQIRSLWTKACSGHALSDTVCTPWRHGASKLVVVFVGDPEEVSCWCHIGDDDRERRLELTLRREGNTIGSISASGRQA
ncbi:unnamed protein product [Cylindrotheca closterium]|uniref:Uncharacterized protein n=1 Tax=Cylindrotheca closterium TaxID=2856 RepID=A0AAD2G065_9STRA|nr:unnamed protein product [Cylindrotheca closterium]